MSESTGIKLTSINDVFALAVKNDALVAELEQAHRDRAALIREDNAIKSALHLTITDLRALLLKPRDAIALLLATDLCDDFGMNSQAILDAWTTLAEWLIETTPHGSEAGAPLL